jgi:riboflavin transporter FmnP
MIVRVAIFGSLATILYVVPYLQFSLPFAPDFLKIHLDEIPIFIAGYAYGPTTAFLIIMLKSLFKLMQDIPATGGIGVLCDFVYSLAFIIPAALFYKRFRTLKGAIISMAIGLFSQLLFSSVIGLYLFFPLYGLFYGATDYEGAMSLIGGMFTIFDPSITTASDPKVIYEFLIPFNLIKDSIVIGATFLTYKPLRIFLERRIK